MPVKPGAREKPYGTLGGQPAPEGGYGALRALLGDEEEAAA